MIEKATNRELTTALNKHLAETEKQVQRLEQAFEMIGEKPKGTSCPAIDGIIKEANELAGEVEDKNVLDAAILAAAQAVEHYEITRYGTLIAWAEELEKGPVAKLLAVTERRRLQHAETGRIASFQFSHLHTSWMSRSLEYHRAMLGLPLSRIPLCG